MNLRIINLDSFKKDVKRLLKKYKRIVNDLKSLNDILSENPKAGIALGNGLYKIRLENSSVPTGKRSGFRIVYYYLDTQDYLYLMTIYSKNELDNINDNELKALLKKNGLGS